MFRSYPSFPVVALACAMLAGCAVGPDYQRPDAPVPQAFKEASDTMPAWTGDWKTAEPQDAMSRPDWWRVFNDPALDALMSQVQVSNQNIKAAEAVYRQAAASLAAARAGYFPTLGANAKVSRGAAGANSAVVNGQSATLSASWEIDVWGRVRRQVESAEAGAQASQADLASTLLSTQAGWRWQGC